MSVVDWLFGTGRSSSVAFGRGQASACLVFAVAFLPVGESTAAAIAVTGVLLYALSALDEWVEKQRATHLKPKERDRDALR